MPLNLGYIRMEAVPANGIGAIVVMVYYDETAPFPGQPLKNGPRGYCLDVSNTTGKRTRVDVDIPGGGSREFLIGQGDPVTNRSLTKAQVNALGYNTREDMAGLQISMDE